MITSGTIFMKMNREENTPFNRGDVTMKKDVYEIINERVIELIEQGVTPWQKQ